MAEKFLSIPANQVWKSELVVNKSSFLGYAISVDSEEGALKFIEEKRKEFSDARHVCFAYCIGNVMRFSDDGEPCGTAGKPILDVIVKQNINNVVLVVVRYFGGIKLGAGPLLRTYSKCAKQTLDGQFSVWEKAKLLKANLTFKEYQQLVSLSLKTKIKIFKTDFLESVNTSVIVPIDFDFSFGKILEQKEIFYSF